MADPSNTNISDTLTQNSVDTSKSAKVISKEDKKDDISVSFTQLFRYASPMDKLLIFIGSVGAVITGAAMPLMTILFANVIQAFLDFSIAESRGEDMDAAASILRMKVRSTVILIIILAAGVFILSCLQMGCWMVAGENQAKVTFGVNISDS